MWSSAGGEKTGEKIKPTDKGHGQDRFLFLAVLSDFESENCTYPQMATWRTELVKHNYELFAKLGVCLIVILLFFPAKTRNVNVESFALKIILWSAPVCLLYLPLKILTSTQPCISHPGPQSLTFDMATWAENPDRITPTRYIIIMI